MEKQIVPMVKQANDWLVTARTCAIAAKDDPRSTQIIAHLEEAITELAMVLQILPEPTDNSFLGRLRRAKP